MDNAETNMTKHEITLGPKNIHRIGYGAMRLPGMRDIPRNDELAIQLLQQSVELGVNIIDSADFYGDGLANQLIADALSPYSDDLILSTKVGVKSDANGAHIPAATAGEIQASIERNLESLRTDSLDIVFLRLAGGPLADSGVPIEESLSALEKLKRDGLIKHIGLSSVTSEQLDTASTAYSIDAVQNAYFIGHTHSRKVLEMCAARHIPFLAYFPLGMGKLSENQTVKQLAAAYQVSEAKLALAWLLQLSPVMVPIPGTANPEHLKDNLTATDLVLKDSDVELLNNIG
jgi:pyridoxine 4-dehydrogenase